MEILGFGATLLALFVTFGLMIGVLFGFFGMGGSFLVTPVLLVMGYAPKVAVGSGLAFVFGTSVIATLKHRNLGQIDYKLGVSMIVGTAVGIEVGKELVLALEAAGSADVVITTVYVALLGSIGVFVTREAMDGDDDGGELEHDSEGEIDPGDVPNVARRIRTYRIPPMLTLRGGVEVSLWTVLAVAFATGLLSGFLGVGGGFIRMPALFYLIGVPVPVAVGTDLFGIVFSGGIGSYLYASADGVRLDVVAPLLVGSALGARLGSAATSVVDEGEIKVYFGFMLIGGAVAVAFRQLSGHLGVEILDTASFVLIVTSALLVSGAVVYASVRNLRSEAVGSTATPGD